MVIFRSFLYVYQRVAIHVDLYGYHVSVPRAAPAYRARARPMLWQAELLPMINLPFGDGWYNPQKLWWLRDDLWQQGCQPHDWIPPSTSNDVTQFLLESPECSWMFTQLMVPSCRKHWVNPSPTFSNVLSCYLSYLLTPCSTNVWNQTRIGDFTFATQLHPITPFAAFCLPLVPLVTSAKFQLCACRTPRRWEKRPTKRPTVPYWSHRPSSIGELSRAYTTAGCTGTAAWWRIVTCFWAIW